MSEQIAAAPDAATGDMRASILRNPELVLEDPGLMRALLERARGPARDPGAKVVDLRAVAMERLEERLDRLDAAHRTVIAAAYDNLAGTQQVHRAVLALLEAASLDALAVGLEAEVAAILRLREAALMVEGDLRPHEAPEIHGALQLVTRGTVAALHPGIGEARVALRRLEGSPGGSEAVLALDLGERGPRAVLVLRSDDPDHLAPGQGTELLEFLAGVVERTVRRWLD